MAGEGPGKPPTRPAGRPASKGAPKGASRGSTRRGLKQAEPATTWRQRVDALLINAPLGWGVVIGLAFLVVVSALSIWAREQPLVAAGRVMDRTRVVRLAFDEVDPSATEQARQLARERRPDIYVADMALFDELRSSLATLPRTVSVAAAPDDVEERIRERFELDEPRLAALKAEMGEEAPNTGYVERIGRFIDQMMRTPMLDAETWQLTDQGLSRQIELRFAEGDSPELIDRTATVNIADRTAARSAAQRAAERVGFDEPLVGLLMTAIAADPEPTFRFDRAATNVAQAQAADEVPPVIVRWAERSVIFARGDVLSAAQLALYEAELRAFARQAEAWRPLLRRLSVAGAVGALTLGIGVYVGLFCRDLRSRPGHLARWAALIAVALAIGVVSIVARPVSWPIAASVPVLLCAAVSAIAFSRRTGLALGSMIALLMSVSAALPIGVLLMLLGGVGVVVWRIDDLRQRNALVRLGLWTAVVLAGATMLVAVIERPMVPKVLVESAMDAGMAAIAGVLVGAITLFVLPWIERAFDVTTGMTLVELRDPRHPLLKELLQLAPGTYNHSLNVASIAETAADAIGADSLLTYVGALYHDVGKMNKPEYFVENQQGGPNKHERLNPSMSLLVIIGHVKDGLEIARGAGIPRPLHHFIEAHHGTTLVEYFYRRAVEQAGEQAGETSEEEIAEADAPAKPDKGVPRAAGRPSGAGGPQPEEIEYRYPGPKPRTKECAILMLADAVESATRSLREPTPSRIDQLVRSLANKRLLDGQFDQCDLTNRELNLVVDSISRSVAAVYHGRVQYPSDRPAARPASRGA